MKKIIAICITALLGAGILLTGCGSSADNTPEVTDAAATPAPTAAAAVTTAPAAPANATDAADAAAATTAPDGAVNTEATTAPGASAAATTAAAEPKANDTLYCCASDYVTLRESASTESADLAHIASREAVTYLDTSGDFYHVNYNGQEGYVRKTYLSADANAPLNND